MTNQIRIAYTKNAIMFFAYLFLVWGFYRLFFRYPEIYEEGLIKPVIWLLPLLFLLKKEKQGLGSLGFTSANLFSALYYALFLGVFFALEGILVNYTKYNFSFDFGAFIGNNPFWTALGISFMTAFSEEVAFRGYIFGRLWKGTQDPWVSIVLQTVLWVLIHVPITIFVNKLGIVPGSIYLALTGLYGMGSAFVFYKTKNISSSILLHLLWEWPIILFR